jgi:20S proteasome subunit beta 5
MAQVLNKYCPIDDDPSILSAEDIAILSPPSSLPTFSLPPISNPTTFLRHHIDEHKNPDCTIKLAHGTTTLAFRFNGGIVVAVDSRATAGTWIASQTVKKGSPSSSLHTLHAALEIGINRKSLKSINSFLGRWLAVLRIVNSGTSAQKKRTLGLTGRETYLGMECRLHELRNKERISVAAASKILSNIVYGYKGMGLSMGTMVCGWDKTGPTIFYVDSDGLRVKGDAFCVGSGSTFAYGNLPISLERICFFRSFLGG